MLAGDVSRLLTTPANVPALSMHAMFSHRRETLRVDYITHPESARMLLPEPLEVPPIARASVYVTQYFDTFSTDPVIELAQAIEAVGTDGRVDDCVQAVYTESVPALVGNRESFLQPSLFGAVSISHRNAVTDFSLRINDVEALRGSAGYKTEAIAHDDALELFGRPKFFLKILGAPWLGEPTRPTLFGLEPTDLVISEAYRAPARVALFGHVMAPLDDLPIVHVESCQMISASWTMGTARVLHRYT